MKVILSGMHSDACEAAIIESFAPFFHIRQVEMIREGSPDNPWAVLHIADSYERAWEACNTLRGVFHRGKRLHVYIPLHQPDIITSSRRTSGSISARRRRLRAPGRNAAPPAALSSR